VSNDFTSRSLARNSLRLVTSSSTAVFSLTIHLSLVVVRSNVGWTPNRHAASRSARLYAVIDVFNVANVTLSSHSFNTASCSSSCFSVGWRVRFFANTRNCRDALALPHFTAPPITFGRFAAMRHAKSNHNSATLLTMTPLPGFFFGTGVTSARALNASRNAAERQHI